MPPENIQVPISGHRLLDFLTRRYPEHPVTDDSIIYPDSVVEELKTFKKYCRCKYQTPEERFASMCELGAAFAQIYGFALNFAQGEITTDDDEHSYNFNFNPQSNTITMVGKLSIITFLHEFAHALDHHLYQTSAQLGGETFAVKWSLTLFKKVYPKAFEKLIPAGHCLIEQPAIPQVVTQVAVASPEPENVVDTRRTDSKRR